MTNEQIVDMLRELETLGRHLEIAPGCNGQDVEIVARARSWISAMTHPVKAKNHFILKISECWPEAPPSVVDWIADASIGIVPSRIQVTRHMDCGDASGEAWAWIRQLQAGPHPAPAAVDVRELSGVIGTGASSDDHVLSLWVNDRLVAVCNLFRDIRNYTVLVRCDLRGDEARPSDNVSIPEIG